VKRKRSTKGKAVTRYLTGHTGIPLLTWNGENNTITAPAPYEPYVSTDGAWWRFRQYLDERQESTGIPFVVRYDGSIENVDTAIVGIRLRHFAPVLAEHYKSIADRIEGE